MSPGPVFASGIPEYVWTGKEMVVWGRMPGLCDPSSPPPCIGETGGRYDPAADQWKAISLTGLSSDFFRGRANAVGVWTGKEMLVWGGSCPESIVCGGGAAYDPAQDRWRTMSDLNGPPRGRERYAAIWTGTRMILWGGTEYDLAHPPAILKDVGNGFTYDPGSDAWTPISSVGAPSARSGVVFAWTGTRMIIWGGTQQTQPDSGVVFTDGALYDPVSDTWQTMKSAPGPRGQFYDNWSWTGTELLVWSMAGTNGIAYDPATDAWRTMSSENTPRLGPFVWTGAEMLIWSGNAASPGGRYNPQTDRWGTMARAGQPSARLGAIGLWTGSEMIVWGGQSGLRQLADGGRFTP